jgi:hypothetical protein
MSKRLNPYRRAAALAARIRMDERQAKIASAGAVDAKLQQGRVRSVLDTQFTIGYHAPKSGVPSPKRMSSRSEGITGKVVAGKVKWKREEPSKVPPAGTKRKPRLRDWRGLPK